MKKDPSAVRSIAQQTQYEEKEAETLARALALVLYNLWNPRAEVAHSTRIA